MKDSLGRFCSKRLVFMHAGQLNDLEWNSTAVAEDKALVSKCAPMIIDMSMLSTYDQDMSMIFDSIDISRC